jgi:hypothetical protein
MKISVKEQIAMASKVHKKYLIPQVSFPSKIERLILTIDLGDTTPRFLEQNNRNQIAEKNYRE